MSEVKRKYHALQSAVHKARNNGKLLVVRQLMKQLRVLRYNSIHSEVKGPMIGHCGQWQAIVDDKAMCCCVCGSVLLALSAKYSLQQLN